MMFIESGIVEAVVINQMTTGDDGVLVVPVSASFCKVLALSVFKIFHFFFLAEYNWNHLHLLTGTSPLWLSNSGCRQQFKAN
jgi:hypothetical protein